MYLLVVEGPSACGAKAIWGPYVDNFFCAKSHKAIGFDPF